MTIGSRIGVVSSISARPSSTEPSSSSNTVMTMIAVIGPPFSPCTSAETCSASPVKLMNTAKISAPMITT